VTLVWAVPVVAAAVATVLVVASARRLEAEVSGVVAAVRRLRDVAGPLAAVREATAETDELAGAFRRRHALDDEGVAGD
jgi:cytochrome c-type biogenesis protein CcmH/NrfF